MREAVEHAVAAGGAQVVEDLQQVELAVQDGVDVAVSAGAGRDEGEDVLLLVAVAEVVQPQAAVQVGDGTGRESGSGQGGLAAPGLVVQGLAEGVGVGVPDVVQGRRLGVVALFVVLFALFFRRRLLMRGGGTIRVQVRVSTMIPGRGWSAGRGSWS